MLRCICCLNPCNSLLRTYDSGAIAVQKCDKCGSSVDEYLESDALRLGIDLCLGKREAFRHTLFNSPFGGASTIQLLFAIFGIDLHYRWQGALRHQETPPLMFVIALSLTALLSRIITITMIVPTNSNRWNLIIRAVSLSQFCKLFSLLIPIWTTDFSLRYAILFITLRADAIVIVDCLSGNALRCCCWSFGLQIVSLGVVCLLLGESSKIWNFL